MEKCREVNGGKGGLLTILGSGLGFHFVLALRPSPIQSQICVHVSLHTFFFPLVKSPAFVFLVSECGRGKSFRSRLLFIDICKFIMELFSRRFFKENFFEFLLELGSVSLKCTLNIANWSDFISTLAKAPQVDSSYSANTDRFFFLLSSLSW